MGRPGIVFLDADTLGEVNGFLQLTKLGNLTVYQTTPPDQRINRIRNNEIVVVNKVIIDREVMDACTSMKLICIAATGMNNVDLEYAAIKGIAVRNVAGYSTESVVQHTFSILFYLMGNLRYYDNYVKQLTYAKSNLFTHHGKPFHELACRQYGIIGLGSIGKRVAEVATAFGADVLYYSTTQKNLNSTYKHLSISELLHVCDIISIHCPLTADTRNLIGYEQLCMMKKGTLLINMGRGGIVNETDLARALNEGLISGAGLDVLEKEPPDINNPLFHISNPEKLFITPHIAWASIESRDRLMEGIIGNITSYFTEKENSMGKRT